ncbi:MAG: hypothetical protein KGL35_30155, partial [Bradyrhizobium sp.]|nr:hypothetical protein [Bradyrhizobium sp.]
MPLSPSTSRPRPPRRQLAITAAGLLDENFSPVICNGDSALSTQVVYGQLLGLYAGDIVTGVLLRNSLAASGTLPTTVRAGIADSTGKILALSGNLNATVTFPLGACPLAFSATYQVINDGGYYACVVKNGVYGTNEP